MVLKIKLDQLVSPPTGHSFGSIRLIQSIKSLTKIELVEPAIEPMNWTVQPLFFKPKEHFDAFCTKMTMFLKKTRSLYEEPIQPICHQAR